MLKERLVVIGGGAAGMSAALKAARFNPDLSVTVIEKAPVVSLSRCGLYNYIFGEVEAERLIALKPEKIEIERGIDLLTGYSVVSIDRAKKEITTERCSGGGRKILEYNKLVLATGSVTRLPNIKNIEKKENLFVLRSLDDARRIISYLNTSGAKEAAIIGAGAHGVGLASAFRKRGLSVTIYESKREIFEEFPVEIRNATARAIADSGCKLVAGVSITEAIGSEKVDGLIIDGKEIPVDIVVLTSGNRPNVELARDAGIELSQNGVILSDDFRMTSDFAIFAAGDCSTVRCFLTGKQLYQPSASLANRTGYIAGMNAAGAKERFIGTSRNLTIECFGYFLSCTGLDAVTARREGYETVSAQVEAPVRSSYVSGEKIILNMIFNRKTGDLIGAQAGGSIEAVREIDILNTALYGRLDVYKLSMLDAGYQPSSSAVYRPYHYASRKALKQL